MRSIALVVLGLFAALPSVRSALARVDADAFQLTHRRDRKLQTDVSSDYTAIWYFVHEGSCSDAEQPSVELSCGNGAISGIQSSEFASCASVDASSAMCTTAAASSSGHAADFTCTGASLDDTRAQATLLEEVSECLGGDQQAAEWGQGILLSLLCDGQNVLNGTCSPANTTFPDSTCTSGWSCPIGNCTEQNYTIIEMTSSVTTNDCSNFESTETSGSPIGIMSVSFAVGVAFATMVMAFGVW